MIFRERLLGDLLTFQRGFDITKAEQSPGEVPIVSSSGISSFHSEAKVRGPGVVIGRKGSLGTVHFLSCDFWPHDTTLWIKDFKGNDPRFLSYFLSTLHLEVFDTGSSNPTLNRNHVHKIKVLAPEPADQHKIAALLSAYDDLIANNQRRIALLESMAEEIYREWFVRMRFPGANTQRAQALSRFDHLCVLSRGFDLPDDDMKPGDVPVIASTSIKGYHNVAKVKPPVVTTGRSGSLGTVLLVNEPAWPLNTALYVKDFKGNSPHLVFFTLKNLHLENFNAGAGVPTLNRNHLAGIRVHVPSLGVQQAFDRRIGPMLQLSETLRKSNAGLTAQRDALLPRLISGKLRVDQLHIQAPPSMRADTAPAV